jgi:DNA-binding NarL/FixJ family response regulator
LPLKVLARKKAAPLPAAVVSRRTGRLLRRELDASPYSLAQTNNLLAEIIKPRQIIPNISTYASGGIKALHRPVFTCMSQDDHMDIKTSADRLALLSDRQREVVALVCSGLSNRAVAATLGVREGTIKGHLHAIYEKLGVQSRFELFMVLSNRAAAALRQGSQAAQQR